MKIVIDAFGGDNAPLEIIKGAIDALKQNSELELVLVGNAEIIQKHIAAENYNGDRIEIINATDIIDNNEAPAVAIRKKENSSIVVAFKALKEREDIGAFVSAGSTGAVLAGSLLKLGRAKGVLRPTLISTFPTVNKRKILLTDCGANVDCKPEYLVQFAHIANLYSKLYLNIDKPKVALLNVGAEDEKGNELTKDVFKRLKETKLNFVGNVEAREYLTGEVDVIVADGFDGNVMMKATEGAALNLMKLIKEAIYGSFVSKIGGLLIKKRLKKVKDYMDYSNYGGAIILGCKKIVYKCHGSSKAKSICKGLLEVNDILKTNLAASIEAEFAGQTENESEQA